MGGIATPDHGHGGSLISLDNQALERLESKIGRGTVLRLVALFLSATEARLSMIDGLREQNDFVALRQIAHDWISDSAAVGASALSTGARQVEALAIAREPSAWPAANDLANLARAARVALSVRYGEAA